MEGNMVRQYTTAVGGVAMARGSILGVEKAM